MKYVDIRDLPPCSLSPQCLRLIDDLDMPTATTAAERLAYIEDLQDERHLRQLRSHVPNCPTCSALLAEARRMRTQQRMMLYYYMVANERQVPATSNSIIEAIRRESALAAESEASENELQERSTLASKPALRRLPAAYAPAPALLYPRPAQHSRIFQNVLTLATVAAVILAAVGLLNRFMVHPAGTTTAAVPNHTPNPRSSVENDGWNSALVGLTVLSAGMVSSLKFYNYETDSGRLVTLISSTQVYIDVNMEGVSQDGQSLLFDTTTPNQQKAYQTVSGKGIVQTVYDVTANQGGNALWMDTTHFLVQNPGKGVRELNTLTGAVQQSWTLETGVLSFYRQPYLYYVGTPEWGANTLYRANLSLTNPTPQRITSSSPNTHFWLSVDGTTIFYANRSSSEQGIYAVGSDGSNLRVLRKGPGVPIGYASDNALMVMDRVENKFRVIKLGATASIPDRVILADAAPGGVSLCGLAVQVTVADVCDQNIELAPYGHGLMLNAYYPNGTSNLLYDNLDTGTSRVVSSLPAGTTVQLPGWSKMSLSPAA